MEKIVKLGKSNLLEGITVTGELARQALIQQLKAQPNLLEAKSSARFVTGNLRTAVQIRAGQCQTHGCVEPATRSEVDHIISHKTGGATDAQNSQVLCHHHHEIKSHGHLPGSDPPQRASPDPPPDWAAAGGNPSRVNPGGAS
ncbi:HNH endonuclease signature motif containing protein [Nesterenkonia ebinurensis]|uniref:HNH endonuclease signature motif containing protein n=1 Tax=Nesterenkonia ebinurensis TaxID=2608252 RepID=UPI00168B1D2E|nr:HNH endonuclease signature motif containing protein [Nesterenkonia ebinurensis]